MYICRMYMECGTCSGCKTVDLNRKAIPNRIIQNIQKAHVQCQFRECNEANAGHETDYWSMQTPFAPQQLIKYPFPLTMDQLKSSVFNTDSLSVHNRVKTRHTSVKHIPPTSLTTKPGHHFTLSAPISNLHGNLVLTDIPWPRTKAAIPLVMFTNCNIILAVAWFASKRQTQSIPQHAPVCTSQHWLCLCLSI